MSTKFNKRKLFIHYTNMGYFPLLIISLIFYISPRIHCGHSHHLCIVCTNLPSVVNYPGKVSNEDPEAFSKADSIVTSTNRGDAKLFTHCSNTNAFSCWQSWFSCPYSLFSTDSNSDFLFILIRFLLTRKTLKQKYSKSPPRYLYTILYIFTPSLMETTYAHRKNIELTELINSQVRTRNC